MSPQDPCSKRLCPHNGTNGRLWGSFEMCSLLGCLSITESAPLQGLQDSSPCSLSFPVLAMAQVTLLSVSSCCDMLPYNTLEAEGIAFYGVEHEKL